MKHYVEFYFPGISCAGQKEKEVSSLDLATIIDFIPKNAISFRFFSKDDSDTKVNYSAYHYLGTEYSSTEFKTKFPQLNDNFDLSLASRIVKTRIGSFYPLSETDVVISV